MSPLNYYMTLTDGGSCQVELNQEEAAAVIKAHDWGISKLARDEIKILDRVMTRLKNHIRP